MAGRLARDIPEGWYVNLGTGLPTMIADQVPADREIVFHSENGILGMGPTPPIEQSDPWLMSAGKRYVTLNPGGCYFHHADSFAMVRGGHLDLCVLGAFEVAGNGDIANWITNEEGASPAVGGAMDLVVGAKRVWVIMEHETKEGRPRVVSRCTYPLTGRGAVARIYTNLAVLHVDRSGLKVVDMVEDLSFAELQDRTGARLIRGAER